MAVALLALGCRQGAPTTAVTDETSPACAAVLAATARAPKFTSFEVLTTQARSRGAESDLARLSEAACPFAWGNALEGPDAALARRVLERCTDAEAPLALVCLRKGRLSADESSTVVAWAARHPLAREEDGPALRAAAFELERSAGPQEAVDALARVAYARR